MLQTRISICWHAKYRNPARTFRIKHTDKTDRQTYRNIISDSEVVGES